MTARFHDDPDQHTMSFGDHLEELRRRILFALIVPLPLMILIFSFSDSIVVLLRVPLDTALRANDMDPTMQTLGPAEALMMKMKLSIIAAIIAAAPWILWQAWQFIAPGLYQYERRFVRFLIPLSAILTLAGTALMYFVMLPLILHVLVGFGGRLSRNIDPGPVDDAIVGWLESNPDLSLGTSLPDDPAEHAGCLLVPAMDLYAALPDDEGVVTWTKVSPSQHAILRQEFRLSEYVSFTLMLFLGIVIAFQMPLVILLLHWVGIADGDWLRRHRRHALLVCAAISALITPADVISMIAMLLPLYALYEFGLLLVHFAPARRVAEGRVLRGESSTSENEPSDPSNPTEAVQSESGTRPRRPLDQWNVDADDGEGDDSRT